MHKIFLLMICFPISHSSNPTSFCAERQDHHAGEKKTTVTSRALACVTPFSGTCLTSPIGELSSNYQCTKSCYHHPMLHLLLKNTSKKKRKSQLFFIVQLCQFGIGGTCSAKRNRLPNSYPGFDFVFASGLFWPLGVHFPICKIGKLSYLCCG